MRGRQIKRKRPNIDTAHQFFREGSFLIDPDQHFLSGKEREAELESISGELHAIVGQQFPRTQNLEFAILKAHLIIEYALVQYIRSNATTYVDRNALRFSFSQKLEIAYLLGFGAHDPILLPTVECLNKIRNQVAHTFELNRNAFDEILQINTDEYKNFKPKNDRDRIKHLRRICTYICGRVSGEMIGAYFASLNSERKLQK